MAVQHTLQAFRSAVTGAAVGIDDHRTEGGEPRGKAGNRSLHHLFDGLDVVISGDANYNVGSTNAANILLGILQDSVWLRHILQLRVPSPSSHGRFRTNHTMNAEEEPHSEEVIISVWFHTKAGLRFARRRESLRPRP